MEFSGPFSECICQLFFVQNTAIFHQEIYVFYHTKLNRRYLYYSVQVLKLSKFKLKREYKVQTASKLLIQIPYYAEHHCEYRCTYKIPFTAYHPCESSQEDNKRSKLREMLYLPLSLLMNCNSQLITTFYV